MKESKTRYSIEFDDIFDLLDKVERITSEFKNRAKKKCAKLDEMGIRYELIDEIGMFVIPGDMSKEQQKQVDLLFKPKSEKRFSKKFGITEIK